MEKGEAVVRVYYMNKKAKEKKVSSISSLQIYLALTKFAKSQTANHHIEDFEPNKINQFFNIYNKTNKGTFDFLQFKVWPKFMTSYFHILV